MTTIAQQRKYRKANLEKCRGYGRNYARKNSVRIAAERKAAMQDADHAEAVREYFADYWRKRVGGHVPKSPPMYRCFDGEAEQIFRTSEAARLLHCSAAVLLKWHQKSWVPLPLIVDGRRWYRRSQIDVMGLLLSVRKRDSGTRAKVLSFISENW